MTGLLHEMQAFCTLCIPKSHHWGLSPLNLFMIDNLLKGLVCMVENYSEALRKLKVAEFHSDLSAESASEDKGGRHERHERRHDIAQDNNCSQSARKKYLSVSSAAPVPPAGLQNASLLSQSKNRCFSLTSKRFTHSCRLRIHYSEAFRE